MHFQIPLKINALVLDTPRQIIGQDIVFENIPWFSQEQQAFINSLTPFVSQSVIPRPFSNDNLVTLDKGMHLHWQIPSILKTFDEYGTLPEAPNRWLIIKNSKQSGKEEWLVESDYIWDINQESFSSNALCSYPFSRNNKSADIKEGFDFKYVGRKFRKNETRTDQKPLYLDSLTALGWGSLSFDSHYANCRSIFGFHDENFDPESEVTYTIIGFYSKDKGDDDYFKSLIKTNRLKLKDKIKSLDLNKILTDEIFRRGMDAENRSEDYLRISGNLNINNLLSEIDKSIIFDLNHAFDYFLEKSSFTADEYARYVSEMPIKINDWKINSYDPSDTVFEKIKTLCIGSLEYNKTNISKQEDHSESLNVSIANTLPEALTAILLKDYQAEEKLVHEEQLEAILNWGELSDKNLDWVNRLRNKRHENQFKTISGTGKWEIVPIHKNTEEKEDENLISKIPLHIEEKLDALNNRQAKLDVEKNRLYHDLEAMYIDWHTYLMSLFVYKKQDLSHTSIRIIIEKKLLPLISATEAKIKELQSKIYNQKRYISDLLGDGFELELKTDISFYESVAPTVIVYDENPDESSIDFLKNSYQEIQREIYIQNFDFDEYGIPVMNSNSALLFEISNAFNTWNTYKVEWEAFFMPNKNNESEANMETDFITANYVLDDQNADLIKDYHLQNLKYSQYPNLYYGNSFVSETVKSFVANKLNTFLKSQDLSTVQFSTEGSGYRKATARNRRYIDEVKTRIRNINLLELSLSDFNNLFVQRTSALNLMPLIPNGFGDHRELASVITGLIKKYESKLNLLTPNSSAQFNPFRNGAFKLNRLRLVDTFGRDKILDVKDISTSYHQQIPYKENWISLPPRLAQAAAISGKWEKLSGTSSSVLGWFVADKMNNSLGIFNEKGNYLGAFSRSGKWEPSPFDVHFASETATLEDENLYLQNVINWLRSKANDEQNFIPNFIQEMILTLEHIEPENYRNISLGNLSTTPLAITRMNINLFVKGGLLHDLSAESQRLFSEKGGERDDLNYSKVKIPINVGDSHQYNDGCVAYWHYESDEEKGVRKVSDKIYFNDSEKAVFNNNATIEESVCDLDNRYRHNTFSPENDENNFETRKRNLIDFLSGLMIREDRNYITKRDFLKSYTIEGSNVWIKLLEQKILIPYTQASEKTYFSQSIQLKKDDRKSYLSIASELRTKSYILLMHPKGDLFIKSGILPVKKLEMPFQKIQNALKKIALTMYSGPVITPKNYLEISLPKDQGHQWSWIELEKEKHNIPIGSKNTFRKIRYTQAKSFDLKKCNISGYFNTVEDLENYLFDRKIISTLRPFRENTNNAFLVLPPKRKRETAENLIYQALEDKFYLKRWKKFYSNFDDNYKVAEILSYTSSFKKSLLDRGFIHEASIFKDEKYVVFTEKFLELGDDQPDLDRILKRIGILSPDQIKELEIESAQLIDLTEELKIYVNLSIRSQEYLQSELLDPDDFFVGEYVYFINEKKFAEFEIIYNELHGLYETFSDENLKKTDGTKNSVAQLLYKIKSFAEIFERGKILEISIEEIVNFKNEAAENNEFSEVLLNFYQKIEAEIFSVNSGLPDLENLKSRLLKIMNSKEAKFTEKFNIHYKTFEFILANRQAISSIGDFNTANTSVPQIMMKEGWLSIKPTNY